MLLSIGMIVKNEEKYLRRCLEAIMPILRQIDSELIIADTGSTDNTERIAKEFTNNVFFFEWCNDFSAARNAVLNRSKGKWIMSIDADEIIQDASDLIRFFESGEFKEYKTATYKIRNYKNSDLKDYSDYEAFRLSQRVDDLQYKNVIHEVLTPHLSPTKRLQVIADHYGYINDDDIKFIADKTQRNLKLLLPLLTKDPNCKNYFDVYRSYDLAGDYKEALEYCKKGYVLAKKQKNVLLPLIWSDMAHLYNRLENYTEAIKVIEEYFHDQKGTEGIDLEMLYVKANSYYKLHDYIGAISSYKSYLCLYNEYVKTNAINAEKLLYPLRYANNQSMYTAVYNLVESLIFERNFDEAEQYINLIDIHDFYSDIQQLLMRLLQELSLMTKRRDFSRLQLLYAQCQENKNVLKLLQDLTEEFYKEESNRALIIEALVSVQIESEYFNLIKLRYSHFNKTLTSDMVVSFILEVNNWIPSFADIIYFSILLKTPLKTLSTKLTIDQIDPILFNSAYLSFVDLPQVIYRLSEDKSLYEQGYPQQWLSTLYFWAILSGQLEDSHTVRLFYSFSSTFHNYLLSFYSENVLIENDVSCVAEELKLGFHCYLALNSTTYTSQAEHLKAAVRLCPQLNDAAMLLINEWKRKQDESEKTSEFERYATQIKMNIKSLIKKGNFDEAYNILKSYEQICPNDTEVIFLMEELKKPKISN
jgi:glycosyltransferase involved in cell wall biosynthesis